MRFVFLAWAAVATQPPVLVRGVSTQNFWISDWQTKKQKLWKQGPCHAKCQASLRNTCILQSSPSWPGSGSARRKSQSYRSGKSACVPTLEGFSLRIRARKHSLTLLSAWFNTKNRFPTNLKKKNVTACSIERAWKEKDL